MAAAALVIAALVLSSAGGAAPRAIQIGIAHRVAEVEIEPLGDFTLVPPRPAPPHSGSAGPREVRPGVSYALAAVASGGLRLGEWGLADGAALEPAVEGATVRVGASRYAGRLILRRNDDATVSVVNELSVEDYLLGVIPHEMEPDWPLEALKAQVVVARSFAYGNLGKYRGSGFDLSPDTRSQVYRGFGSANSAVREAVDSTRGEVLGWSGKLLPVYYHSTCGGRTTSPHAVWGAAGRPPPPLAGVRDGYCKDSPHWRWTTYVLAADLAAAALPEGVSGFSVSEVDAVRQDRAGFAKEFILTGDGKPLRVLARDLRRRLAAGLLPSLRIRRIRARRKGFEIEGSGAGHGVGLCQWGARGQAGRGRGYENILRHYFPGAVLSVVDE